MPDADHQEEPLGWDLEIYTPRRTNSTASIQTITTLKTISSFLPNMPAPNVPKPGPAVLGPRAGLPEWLEEAKQCHYLPETVMKQLCEMVKECLMEESNIQPVTTPVTICGDIHGQFYDLLELFRIAGGMPGETNVQKPTTQTAIITSDDIEPPTEITDPKLKKKIRSSDSGIESASGEDDDDDEPRGRPRTAGQGSRAGSSGGDSAIGVNNEVSGSGNQNFVFLGDFVDRGYFSLETFTLLMCLKAMYPDKITLVRGNHESRQITQVYGFYEECQQKYGNASVWKSCCQVFDFLVLAAIVDGEVLCVHGGLSPEIRTVDQIRVVARAQEIPHEGAFCDLVWSDPEDVETWAVSPRGAGWLFGDKVATEFNHVNGLKLIARAHQLVNEGYKYHFSQKSVVTVWSAPNYCYRCGNVASIMNVGEDLDPKFSIFGAVPEDQRAVPAGRRGAGEYFL
ncbi:Serine/threonine-protein phosphatase ppe1 [Lachnellula suecica]|uniref:Serine/threonine-protein phosphatase n=1 Tax=Lachnellula suecica TaxID=602035 RepID=A0A8T9C795_9HELO|nr:Serine/threonine-protein phosphatase ppe1 [Lachnellula suecica]